MAPLLSLNETCLLFIPPTRGSIATITQVTLSTNKKHGLSVEALARYYLSQRQISAFVADVLVLHNEQPLPQKSAFVGDGYMLLAERKIWKLGQMWHFKWGGDEITAAEDKWKFTFLLTDES